MNTQHWHSDRPDPGLADGHAATPHNQYCGPTGDLARRAVQRFMWADVRRRSHERAASSWQRVGVGLGVLAALAASLAAVAYVASWGWAAIALSILVALIVPLSAALRCGDRAADHRRAAAALTAASADFERYIQRRLAPSTSSNDSPNVDELSADLDSLENQLRQADWARLPRTSPRRGDIGASAAHGEYLLSGLRIGNLPLPPAAAWV